MPSEASFRTMLLKEIQSKWPGNVDFLSSYWHGSYLTRVALICIVKE